MNLEKFKTILLTNLVIISIFLTWNLWTYQTDLEKVKETVSDRKELETKKESDVIRPHQVAYHTRDKHYVSDLHTNIEEVNDVLVTGSFEEITDISEDAKNASIRSYIHGNDKIELIYPTEIPIDTLKTIYGLKIDKDFVSKKIDRISIDLVREYGDRYVVYFISYEDKNVFKASFSPQSNDVFSEVQATYPGNIEEYLVEDIANKKLLYLPKKERKLKSYYVSSINRVPADPFLDVLFDQNRSYQEIAEKGMTKFTDGTRVVKVDDEDQQLLFINNIITSSEKLGESALIERSINFLNGQEGGWTSSEGGSYLLDEFNSEEGKTSFRFFVDKSIPVFASTTITQQFSKDEVIIYKRPLYGLGGVIDTNTPSTLESGEAFMESLKKSNYVNMEYVSDIRIGYELKKNVEVQAHLEDSGVVTKLEPCWVFKYKDPRSDNKYYKLGEGGKRIGLE